MWDSTRLQVPTRLLVCSLTGFYKTLFPSQFQSDIDNTCS